MSNVKKTLTLAVIAVAGLSVPAFAQEADAMIDVNGDGFYSYPELTAVMPDMTEDSFVAIDTSGDGLLDMEEVAAAEEAGLMPTTEG